MGKGKVISLLVIIIGLVFFVYGQRPIELPEHLQKEKETESKSKWLMGQEEKGYESKLFKEMPPLVLERISGSSYIEGGPVSLTDLAYLQVSYWGFDDKKHKGELIVHRNLAEEVAEIFKELYEAKFPIEKMRLIDEYQADDHLSMADNNTSAFCVRQMTGGSTGYSKHSFGIAIDINPRQNPFVKRGAVFPEEGKFYLDRQKVRKGMIVKGDKAYQAFVNRGWKWGGDWLTMKDYQHFEKDLI